MSVGYVSKSLLASPILVGPNSPQEYWISPKFTMTQPPVTNSYPVSLITGYLDPAAPSNMPLGAVSYFYKYGAAVTGTTQTAGTASTGGNEGEIVTLNATTNRLSTASINNIPVVFYNPGGATLPPELEFNKIYYVVNSISDGTPSCQLSLTEGGAPINFSSAGSGDITLCEVIVLLMYVGPSFPPTARIELDPAYDMQLLDVVAYLPT